MEMQRREAGKQAGLNTLGFSYTLDVPGVEGSMSVCPQELPGYARVRKTGRRWWSGGPSHTDDHRVMGEWMVGQDQCSWVLRWGDAEMGGLGKKVMGSA